MIGRFIVADPAICHGQPTFRGTRILVADVLEQVAAGIAWEMIAEECRGDVSSDAISEAVRLASQAFAIILLSTRRLNTCSYELRLDRPRRTASAAPRVAAGSEANWSRFWPQRFEGRGDCPPVAPAAQPHFFHPRRGLLSSRPAASKLLLGCAERWTKPSGHVYSTLSPPPRLRYSGEEDGPGVSCVAYRPRGLAPAGTNRNSHGLESGLDSSAARLCEVGGNRRGVRPHAQ